MLHINIVQSLRVYPKKTHRTTSRTYRIRRTRIMKIQDLLLSGRICNPKLSVKSSFTPSVPAPQTSKTGEDARKPLPPLPETHSSPSNPTSFNVCAAEPNVMICLDWDS